MNAMRQRNFFRTRTPFQRRMDARPERQRRKSSEVVFFIGAGFTKAITDTAPTGNDFLARAFHDNWTFADDPKIQIELRGFLEDIYHPLREEAQYPRVEDVLSLLDFCILNRKGLNGDYDLDRLVRLKGTLIFLIGQMIKESFYGKQRHHLARKFVEMMLNIWPEREVAVISTNYDIVLDNSLLSKAKSCNYGIMLRHSVNLPSLFNSRATESYPRQPGRWFYEDEFSGGEQNRGRLNQGRILHIKLHGSLNWVYCSRCDEIDITIARKGASNLLEDMNRSLCVNPNCTCPYEAFLIGPTMLKVYSSRVLSELWDIAVKALAQAHKLVFIGYSMPEADYLIRAMLIQGLAHNPHPEELEIVVIDKKPEDEGGEDYLKELTKRYTALLGDRVISKGVGLQGLVDDFETILNLRNNM